MNDRKRRTAVRKQRTGATALEFAIVAPIVFGIIWISLEFLRITMIQNLADVASYEAARVAIVPGATVAEAEDEAREYLRYMGTRNVTVSVQVYKGSEEQSEIDDFTTRIRIVVNVPVQSNALILSRFFGNQVLSSTTSLGFESYSGFYDGNSL